MMYKKEEKVDSTLYSLTERERRFIALVELASRVVLIEDKKLLQELAKY